MAKATYRINVEVEVDDKSPELLKVAAREIIAGIASSVDHNQNVEDIVVKSIISEVIIQEITDCLPDEEIDSLAQ